MTGSEFEVAVVGGGPVGVGLAIELGQRGVRTVVLERYAAIQPVPKGQNLTQRTLEHFHFWGAERELRAAVTVPKSYGIGGLTAYGTLLGRYQHDWLQRELVRPFYFTDNERLPQYATEAVLRQRARALPAVDLRLGQRVERIEQDASGVTVDAVDAETGAATRVRAAYAVGCDGSRSLVREQSGITQTRNDHDRLMVLLLFRSPQLHEQLARFPGKTYYIVLHPSLGGYWQFLGRVDLGQTFFFHAPVPPGTTETNYDFRALLHRAVGATFDVELDYVGFWDLRIATADTYRNGRIFIAGDAAHSHPPYGGYGINTGFEDACNLGWKLAARLSGWGSDALLDSYGDERRPVFQSTASDFIEMSIARDRTFLETFDPERDREAFEREWAQRSSGATSEVHQFEPHYAGSPIVWGRAGERPGAKGVHAFAARAGHHLAPQPLSSGANVYDALGPGFTLLAFGAPAEAAEAFRTAASGLGVPLTVVEDTRDGGRERYEAALVLVRPDQFVAWSGDVIDPPAREILARAAGRAGETGKDAR